MDKDYRHTMVGLGLVDDEPRVAISLSSNTITYLCADSARYLAMQLLMAASKIDPQEEE